MRVHCLRWSLVLFFVLAGARPAHADIMGFLHWFDSLSGPGPWKGVVSDQPIVARGFKKSDVERQERGGDRATVKVVFDPLGTDVRQDRWHWRLGGQWGVLVAAENNQDYGGARPPSIKALPVAGTVDVGKYGIEGGVGVGFVRFFGGNVGFTRGTITPRATFFPIVFFGKKYSSRRAEVLVVRAGWTRILGDITAADFGAFDKVPPQRMGNEWVGQYSIGFNALALYRGQ